MHIYSHMVLNLFRGAYNVEIGINGKMVGIPFSGVMSGIGSTPLPAVRFVTFKKIVCFEALKTLGYIVESFVIVESLCDNHTVKSLF